MELAQPPAASRGSGLGPDSAGFQSLASRVFLGCGNLPAVTYARVLLSNFLLRHGLPGCARPGCPASLWWGKCTLSPWAATLAA